MRIHVSNLIPGDHLIADAFNSYGLAVLVKATILTNDDITSLTDHEIDFVEISYREQKKESQAKKRIPDLKETKIKYNQAVDGIKDVFAQAMKSGKIDDEQIMSHFNPLVDNFKSETDVVSLLLTLSNQDSYTYQHSVQVGILSYYISKWIGNSESEALWAGKAGYLHDIGKSKVSLTILNKPARLTNEEYDEIKKHTLYGYKIINDSFKQPDIAMAALQHHERIDGTGYPLGTKGDQLLPLSKIVAVADIYSAMISSRVYQKERDLLQVLKELQRISFSEIDPTIAITFIKNMLPHFIGKSVTLSNGKMGNIIMTNPTDFFRPLIQLEENFIDLAVNRELQIEHVYI